MVFKRFIKDNFVLVVGLALPVLLMFGFMIASSLPNVITDPPKHDFVFSVASSVSNNLPISLKLNVGQDGVLKAQYIRNPQQTYHYNQWKKLYIYEAETQKVRELPLPVPADMEKIAGTREEIVGATEKLKLDTTLVSPDGYSLSYDGYSRSGLIGDIFLGGSYNSEPRLRKGSSFIRLVPGDTRTPFYYGSIEFIGWVTGTQK
jgi:hypothetical protein